MASAPQLVEKYKEHLADQADFEMIHISMDEDLEAATQWAVKESFPWLTILPEASAEGLMTLYPDEGVPEYILVDTSGKIVLVAPGDQVFAKIKELTPKEEPSEKEATAEPAPAN